MPEELILSCCLFVVFTSIFTTFRNIDNFLCCLLLQRYR